MKSLFITSLAAVAASALVACGQNNNPVANIQAAAAEPGLQGKAFSLAKCDTELTAKWIGSLTQALQGQKIESAPQSSRLSYLFKGTNVTRKTIVYPSKDCSGNPMGTFYEEGTFKINNNDKGEENAAAIDMDFTKLSVTIEDEAGAKVANNLNFCGTNNWSANKASATDVTTKSDDANCYKLFGGKVPRTVANRFLLQDNNTKLYFGTQSEGNVSASSRPTSVNKNVVYSSN